MAFDQGERYVSLEDFKSWVRITTDDVIDDTELLPSLLGAEAAIDGLCQRRFDLDDAATARVFVATDAHFCPIDDASAAPTQIDYWSGNDWVSVTLTDVQNEPLNGVMYGSTGWPYTSLRAIGDSLHWPYTPGEPMNAQAGVRVTAVWGWSAVPAAIVTATRIQAHRYVKRRDSPEGILGFESGTERLSLVDPDLKTMIGPYLR
jgi:hypothetical protein